MKFNRINTTVKSTGIKGEFENVGDVSLEDFFKGTENFGDYDYVPPADIQIKPPVKKEPDDRPKWSPETQRAINEGDINDRFIDDKETEVLSDYIFNTMQLTTDQIQLLAKEIVKYL